MQQRITFVERLVCFENNKHVGHCLKRRTLASALFCLSAASFFCLVVFVWATEEGTFKGDIGIAAILAGMIVIPSHLSAGLGQSNSDATDPAVLRRPCLCPAILSHLSGVPSRPFGCWPLP